MRAIDVAQRLGLPIGLAWTSGIGGLFVGGASVTTDAGLAGGAIVLGYGVVGAALGLVIGGLLAWTLPAGRVRSAVAGTVILALCATAALIVQGRSARAEREGRAAAEEAARLAPFSASVVTHQANDGATFVTIDVDGTNDTFVMTARKRPGRPVCRGAFDESRHARLVGVLRRADEYIDEHPGACADQANPSRVYRWSLPDRGGTPRVVNATLACGQAHSQLLSLYAPFESIAFSGDRSPDSTMVCDGDTP